MSVTYIFSVAFRIYLKAKALDQGWDASSVDSWAEECWNNPVQPDENSCGVYVCMVTYPVQFNAKYINEPVKHYNQRQRQDDPSKIKVVELCLGTFPESSLRRKHCFEKYKKIGPRICERD